MPGISFIVPVYQAEKYLEKCIESVKRQTFQDWELLLIDDGCTDRSPRICDQYAAKDDRIRVFHKKKNAGVSEARNWGLREAKGDCIAFLDSDDGFEPRALETLWSLREQTEADTVGCAHLGARLCLPVFNGFIWRYLFSTRILRSAHITFEGAYLEDELFLMEYFCNAHKLAVTEEPLYRYFFNPNSATHKYMKDFQKVFGRFMERKEEVAARYQLEAARPLWRENTNWAGLLIAIGNEYAKGNNKSVREKQKAVEELCRRPDMARAIEAITPEGLSPNKQMVANLVKKKHFFVLTQLYRLKNRI